jgi:hypothetical protein
MGGSKNLCSTPIYVQYMSSTSPVDVQYNTEHVVEKKWTNSRYDYESR